MAEDLTREAQKIWNALRVMVDQEIDRRTASCVRSRKMTVMSAPNGSTIGVSEPFGQTINIPYSSALANVRVGDTVWVDWKFDNASTMVAMATGDGQIVPDYFDYNDANRNLLEARKFIQTSLTNNGDLSDPTADTVPMDYTGIGTSNYYIHVQPSTNYRLTLYDTRIEADSVSCVVAQYNSNGTFISLAASGIGWRDPQGLTFVTNVNAAFVRLSLVGFPKYRWKLEQGDISTDWQPSPEDVSPYTFDTVPTNNSENPITSGGVYNALATKVSKSGDTMTGDLATPKVTLIAPNVDTIDITSVPASAVNQDVVIAEDKNNNNIAFMRAKQSTDGTTGVEFNARRTVGGTTYFNGVTFTIADDGTKAVSVSDGALWRSAIDAVNKAGDTMTGTLNVPHMRVYDTPYPMYAFVSQSRDTTAFGAVFEDLNLRRMAIRQRSTVGYTEDYFLPTNEATSANAQYVILTTKNPVTAFKDMSITLTSLASGAWTQQSITQFTTPTGYIRTGLSVVGGSTTNIRSYVYVLTNANANWVLLYNASGSSLSGTLTLRAEYILQSMSKEFTQ